MALGVLIVSHEEVGCALYKAATSIMGEPKFALGIVEVSHAMSLEQGWQELLAAAARLGEISELLVLVDLFGATPSNLGSRMVSQRDDSLPCPEACALISGLSLPMLLKLFNHADESLTVLTQIVADGARDGVAIFGGSNGE